MIRRVVILLLLANLLYLGWEMNRQQHLDITNRTVSAIPPGVSKLQVLSEAAPQTIVERQEITPGFETAPELATILPDSESELVSQMPSILSSPDAETLADGTFGQTYCFTFGPIPEDNLATGLKDWFTTQGVSSRQRFTDEQGRQLFWVYLAPVASQAGAMETIDDLRSKGTSDYRLITGGNLANAISLGVYSSQASVNDRLSELEEKGYAPVVVPYATGKRIVWVDVWFGENPDQQEHLLSGFPSRYNYVPVDCSKIDMDPASP